MQILVIDDDRGLCRSLQLHFQRLGHDVQFAITAEEGEQLLAENTPDLAFIDLNLPDKSGIDVLHTIRDREYPCLSVMITGVQDAQSTIEAIRTGAFDYIRKPLDLNAVMATVEKAAQYLKARPARETAAITTENGNPYEIIGAHPSIIEVLKAIALIGESRVPVLIEGESGTGKELVARTLHETACPNKPFVAVNCSAVVPTLLESELFGHIKGAFTGADADKAGKLEVAGEGTIFFDEIGDMSRDLQAKLLRVLQEKEFERVGSTRSLPFKARVIAATNRDLPARIKANEFREDLYYRLAVSTIHVPPLRERRSDIPLLAEHLLAKLAKELHKDVSGIDKGALRRLQAYDWPGNVREMVNVLTRALLLARGNVIAEETILSALGEGVDLAVSPDKIITLRDAEKEHIHKALLSTGWNIKQTAELLGITRVTLRKKIGEYELKRPGHLSPAESD